MPMSDYSLLIHLCTTIGAVAGAVVSIQKAKKNHKDEKDEESAALLSAANSVAADSLRLHELETEAKIKALAADLENHKEASKNEIQHLKDIQANENKHLANKIEELRDQLREYHVQMMGLLSKLVDKN